MISKLIVLLAVRQQKSKFFTKTRKLYSTASPIIDMDLNRVVKRLTEYANLDLACDWDNVGLLVEPTLEPLSVQRILVTNDLTEPVLNEAIQNNVNLIVTYHPAIFRPLKRLTQKDWKERSIVKCIEHKIAVYSPHTTWDSVSGGINDWLMSQFDTKSVEPVETIVSSTHPSGYSKSVKVNLKSDVTKFLNDLKSRENIVLVGNTDTEYDFLTSPNGVVNIIDLVKTHFDDEALSTLRIFDLSKPILKNSGLGRIGVLREPQTVRDVVEQIKRITNLKHVRLALANGKTLDDKIKSIAIGAGSGSKLLNNLSVDLVLTGEFAHHEILHETHRGVSLILTDHSNTERCYFEHFRKSFLQLLSKYNENVEILISKVDRDPLEVV